MGLKQLVALLALAACLHAAAATDAATACGNKAGTSSVMFGAPWRAALALYSQESAWKNMGNITAMSLFYNTEDGCVLGAQATYGGSAENARRLGVSKVGNFALLSAELVLEDGEFFNEGEFQFGSCITFLKLSTNKGRALSIGKVNAEEPIQTTMPASSKGFLAYLNGYTHELGSGPSTGALQRLQLVWATWRCVQQPPVEREQAVEAMAAAAPAGQEVVVTEVPVDAIVSSENKAQEAVEVAAELPAAGGAPAGEAAVALEAVAVESPPAAAPQPAAEAQPAVTEPTAAAPAAESNATTVDAHGAAIGVGPAACRGGATCNSGMCATSSCAVNGMGKDVVTMMCFGTNVMPNPLLAATVGNPCANLACKLDRPNCTSIGAFGMGGFCTGKVVAMGATAKLHPSGKAFVGYPCIEHRTPLLNMMPVGDYTAKGVFVAKAWKVCDCIKGLGLNEESLQVRTINGGSITLEIPDLPILPQFPFYNRSVTRMNLPDVLAQWVVANEAESPIPRIYIGKSTSRDLQYLLPNFTMPSLVIPRISAPLLKLPRSFSLPVFTIPGNDTLNRVIALVPNITSLPTILMPRWEARSSPKLPALQLPEVTITNLNDLAQTFGVPTMPKLPPLFAMTFTDVVTQWLAANRTAKPLPRVHLDDNAVAVLRDLVPSFNVPSMIVANMSIPLLKLPSPFPLPVVALAGNETLQAVARLIPRITSLPTFVLPAGNRTFPVRLPQLNMANVTIPNFHDVVAEVGAQLAPNWPQLALQTLVKTLNSTSSLRLPDFSITKEGAEALGGPDAPAVEFDLTGLTGLVDGLREHLSIPALNISSGLDAVLDLPAVETVTTALQNLLGSSVSVNYATPGKAAAAAIGGEATVSAASAEPAEVTVAAAVPEGNPSAPPAEPAAQQVAAGATEQVTVTAEQVSAPQPAAGGTEQVTVTAEQVSAPQPVAGTAQPAPAVAQPATPAPAAAAAAPPAGDAVVTEVPEGVLKPESGQLQASGAAAMLPEQASTDPSEWESDYVVVLGDANSGTSASTAYMDPQAFRGLDAETQAALLTQVSQQP